MGLFTNNFSKDYGYQGDRKTIGHADPYSYHALQAAGSMGGGGAANQAQEWQDRMFAQYQQGLQEDAAQRAALMEAIKGSGVDVGAAANSAAATIGGNVAQQRRELQRRISGGDAQTAEALGGGAGISAMQNLGFRGARDMAEARLKARVEGEKANQQAKIQALGLMNESQSMRNQMHRQIGQTYGQLESYQGAAQPTAPTISSGGGGGGGGGGYAKPNSGGGVFGAKFNRPKRQPKISGAAMGAAAGSIAKGAISKALKTAGKGFPGGFGGFK